MATVRLTVHMKAVIDVDLEEYRKDEDQFEPGELTDDELATYYGETLAGFFENELANCVEMPGDGGIEARFTTITHTFQEA